MDENFKKINFLLDLFVGIMYIIVGSRVDIMSALCVKIALSGGLRSGCGAIVLR